MRVSCWLQIMPARFADGKVAAATVERTTQSRPREPLPGAALIRLILDVPEGVFAPFEAYGEVPEGAKLVPFTIELPGDPGDLDG